MFTDKDLAQISAHGLTPEQVERQMSYFGSGFPYLNIDRPAVADDGIRTLDERQVAEYAKRYDEFSQGKRIVKFVPASGAATRMFKALFEYLESGVSNPATKELLANLDKFAFAEELRSRLGGETAPEKIIRGIVAREGLGYGSLPKALILFHRYGDGNRTALEEHLSEGALYAADRDGKVNVHFTVSPEHLDAFKARVGQVLPAFEKRYGVRYEISYSQQKPSTDTIAATPGGEPFREEDGSLLFRPAGHGALLENLNEIDADVIFIKNIDNVAPDRLKTDTVTYKKVIGGVMLALQQRCHSYLRSLYNGLNDKVLIGEIARFTEERLGQRLPRDFERLSLLQRADLLYKLLDRPIRVCGMVRNEGEPGGGPFWVTAPDGSQSLQIAESSQIAPGQHQLMNAATHFNPVDVVCGTKNYRGEHFDLRKYVDPSTGFISQKSKSGRELLAQELPGLWNGSMAHWNTVFVEVPVTIFSPVKVVGDLLRPQHQAL